MEVRVLSWAPKYKKPLHLQRLFSFGVAVFCRADSNRGRPVPNPQKGRKEILPALCMARERQASTPSLAQQHLERVLQAASACRIAGTLQYAGGILAPGLHRRRIIAAREQLQL